MTIRKIFFGLLLAVLVLPLGGMNASPAYGLLRSFHETAPDVEFESAYDIKVDQNGIYMVGARHVHDTSGKFPVDAFNPYILILEPDHRLRCTNYLEFPMDGRSRGMAVDLEHNTTHLIVSGYYLFTDGAALFVAAFDKNNCRLTGVYRHFLTEDPSGLGIVDIYPQFFGRGVDAAVDGTNIYVLTGLTIFENDLRCFLVIKLDSNLNYVSHGCFYVEGLQRSGKEGFAWFDFATSIAVASDAVYVVGGVVETPTLIELYRGHMRELFLLRLSKDSLRVEDFLGLSKEDPVPEKFFVGTRVLIDENDDIYIVTTDLFASRHDLVEIYKYRYRGEGNFERVWSAGYVVENVYTRDDVPPSQDGSLPPDLFEYPFSYSLSAALEGPYIFVGGFISDRFFPASALSFNNGFLSAIDKKSGNALFTFRIQPYDNPNGQTFVHGLTAYRGCAYIAGRSDNYRLEYVLQNILHKVLPDREARGLARETDVTHLPRQDLYKEYGWVPSFDQPNEVRRYSFYGVFCPSSAITTVTTSTTNTVTQTTTISATTTQTTDITSTTWRTTTQTTTLATTQIRRIEELFVVLSASYTTATRTVTGTTVTTAFELSRATVTDVRFVTISQVVTTIDYRAQQLPFAETVVSTTTLYRNTTTTSTATFVKPVEWTSLPPWFYAPFLLLPLPLFAVLFRGKRHRVVINKTTAVPMGWKLGDQPVVDDTYITPAVLNIPKNSVVEFVNNDDEPHVVAAYDGPAEYLFQTDEIKPGKKRRHKFTQPGVYYVKSLTKQYVGGIIRVG